MEEQEKNNTYGIVDLFPKYLARMVLCLVIFGFISVCTIVLLAELVDHAIIKSLPMTYRQWLWLIEILFGTGIVVHSYKQANRLYKTIRSIYILMYEDLIEMAAILRAIVNINIVKTNPDDLPEKLIKDVLGGDPKKGPTIH
jgi:hypothetical protein